MSIDHEPPAGVDYSTLDSFTGLGFPAPFTPLELSASLHLHDVRYHRLITPGGSQYNLLVRQETAPAPLPGRRNEDCPAVVPLGPDRLLACVFDGASSRLPITGLEAGHWTGAFYISHLTALGFPRSPEFAALCATPHLTAADILVTINHWLHSQLSQVEGVDYADKLKIPGMSATVCLLDATQQELTVAHVADTVAILATPDGQLRHLTFNQNERFDQETLQLVNQLAAQHHLTPGQTLATPQLKAQVKAQLAESFTRKINTPGCCGILNGQPDLEHHRLIHSASLPFPPPGSLLFLMSDGAFLPYQPAGCDLEASMRLVFESNHRDLDSLQLSLLTHGLNRLLQDPELITHPRLRDDDSTLVVVQFQHVSS